jgi:hypothetical protein
MKEGNINQYIADFFLTVMNAQVDPNKPMVLMLFYQGLPQRLAEKCIKLDSPSNFTSWIKVAQRNHRNWIITQSLRRKEGKPNPSIQPSNPLLMWTFP